MPATYLHENQIAYFTHLNLEVFLVRDFTTIPKICYLLVCLFACLFVLTLHRSIKTQAFPAD